MVLPLKLLRRPEVEALTGLSRSSIYSLIKDGQFPAPIRIGRQAVAWSEAELRKFIQSRAAERITAERAEA